VLPLKGLTVVEVSILVAGPAMGSLLQELGADVIKIEQPVTGDPSRTVSPWGFLNYNLEKKSLTLNLKSERGREILYRLIKEKADIFIENLGPHISDQLGFSYKTLSKIKPSLIYCSIKGFSRKSKDYERPAFDAVAQAMSGVMSLTGEPGGEPVRIGNPATDLAAAAYGTIQVLSALLEKTGKFIEISLLDMSVYWNGYWLTYFGMTGKVPRLLGSGHPGYSPHKVFKTKDGKWVFVATLSDSQWKRLASLLKLDLSQAYDDMKYRIGHRKEVEEAVQAAISKIDSDELLKLLRTEVPSAEVRSIDEIYNDRELEGVVQEIADATGKRFRVAKSPFVLEKTKMKELRVSKLGEQDSKILKSLGYESREIEEFRQSGII
jgi:crotonobetainyl-CoA:carnitine CoA-transferase CaiB-like acyl-CoA transferase